jgi:hypothetical protein
MNKVRGSLALGLLATAAALAATACGSSVTGTAEVQGALDASSFPGQASVIEVTNEAGNVMRPKIDSSGKFRFFAVSGHTYAMRVVLQGGSEPIVFPRSSGKLDKTFQVNGIAKADLGLIKHYTSVPTGGFIVNDTANDPGQCGGDEEDDGGDGECENGIDATTGLACADGDHQDATDEQDGDDPDGEVEDDTGFQDDDASDDGGSFAVGENNLPDQLGCSGDDDNEKADDAEGDD